MRITLDWMKSAKACPEHVVLFEQTWGDGDELTRGNLRLAASLGFRMHWLAGKLLGGDALAAYGTRINAIEDAHRARLEAGASPARERFRAATAPAEAIRLQALVAASDRFRDATRDELAEYRAHQVAAKATHKLSPGESWEPGEWSAYMADVGPRLERHRRTVAPALAEVRRVESEASRAFRDATASDLPELERATRPAIDESQAATKAAAADVLADALGLA